MLKILFYLIAKLPNAWAQRLGNVIGTLMTLFSNEQRRVVRINIARCYPNLSAKEQQHFVKQALQENAKTLLELPRIFVQGSQFALGLIREVEGIEHFHKALEDGKGVILLAPHLGNWELPVHYLSQFTSITGMFDPPQQLFLNDIMRKGRESSGSKLLPADARGVRAQLKQLKKSGVIGILPDQRPTHRISGIHAPFMGHPALTMTLVNNLANRSGATILMSFAERLGVNKGYRLHVFPAPAGISDKDTLTAATALNLGVEQCITIAPTQYQWTYKRFKWEPKGSLKFYRKIK